MSTANLERDHAAPWVAYVVRITKTLVQGRARLVLHDSGMAHQRPASWVLPQTRTAAARVVAAVVKRTEDFPMSRPFSRSGLAWTALENEFTAACVDVRAVFTIVSMAIRNLLHDESLMPPRALSLAGGYFTGTQRAFLVRAQTLFDVRTRQFLIQAESIFVTGQWAPRSIASSSQASGRSQ
jgi:hypothetical protein